MEYSNQALWIYDEGSNVVLKYGAAKNAFQKGTLRYKIFYANGTVRILKKVKDILVVVVPIQNVFIDDVRVPIADLPDRLSTIFEAGGSGGDVTVIDNLTSTSTTDALSANQGRVLNEKVTVNEEAIADLLIDIKSYEVVAALNKAVTVTTTAGVSTVDFNIDANDKVLTQSVAGLFANLALTHNETTGLVALTGKGGQVISSFSMPVDMVLDDVSIEVNPSGQPAGTYIKFVFNTESGKTPIYLNVSDIVVVYTAGNAGINISSDYKISIVVDANSNLEIGTNGLGIKSGFQLLSDAQSTKINNSLTSISTAATDTITFTGTGTSFDPLKASVTIGDYIERNNSESQGNIYVISDQTEIQAVDGDIVLNSHQGDDEATVRVTSDSVEFEATNRTDSVSMKFSVTGGLTLNDKEVLTADRIKTINNIPLVGNGNVDIPFGTSGVDNLVWFDPYGTHATEDGSEQRPFKTIDAAIALANTKTSGTVVVPPATTLENITLTKTLRITTFPYSSYSGNSYTLSNITVDQGVYLYAFGGRLMNPVTLIGDAGGILLYGGSLGGTLDVTKGYYLLEGCEFRGNHINYKATSVSTNNVLYLWHCSHMNLEIDKVNMSVFGGSFRATGTRPIPLNIGDITSNTTWVMNSFIASGNTNLPFVKNGWSGNRIVIYNCMFDFKKVFTQSNWVDSKAYFDFDDQTWFYESMFNSGASVFLAGDGKFKAIPSPDLSAYLKKNVTDNQGDVSLRVDMFKTDIWTEGGNDSSSLTQTDLGFDFETQTSDPDDYTQQRNGQLVVHPSNVSMSTRQSFGNPSLASQVDLTPEAVYIANNEGTKNTSIGLQEGEVNISASDRDSATTTWTKDSIETLVHNQDSGDQLTVECKPDYFKVEASIATGVGTAHIGADGILFRSSGNTGDTELTIDETGAYVNSKRILTEDDLETIGQITRTFIPLNGTFPTSPKVGDVTVMTSNGTSTGDYEYVYEWDGFEWVTKSFNYNLGVLFPSAGQYDVDPIPKYFSFGGTGLWRGKYNKNDNGGSQYVVNINSAYKLTKYNLNDDFRISSLNINEIDYDLEVDGLFNSGDENINYGFKSGEVINSSVKNLNVSSVNINSGSFKSFEVDNVVTSTPIYFYFQSVSEQLAMKNIPNAMATDMNMYFDENNIPTSTIQIEVNNVKNANDPNGEGVLNTYNLAAETTEERYPVNIKLTNVGYTGLYWNNVIVENVELSNFNAKYLGNIHMSSVECTQEVIDNLFTQLIAFDLGSSIAIEMKNIGFNSMTVVPSQAIQDQLIALGYTININ